MSARSNLVKTRFKNTIQSCSESAGNFVTMARHNLARNTKSASAKDTSRAPARVHRARALIFPSPARSDSRATGMPACSSARHIRKRSRSDVRAFAYIIYIYIYIHLILRAWGGRSAYVYMYIYTIYTHMYAHSEKCRQPSRRVTDAEPVCRVELIQH